MAPRRKRKTTNRSRRAPERPAFDVGDSGEDNVRAWASDAGITVNPAARDKTGWDLLFEFPGDAAAATAPIDQTRRPIRCWVQVKATASGATARQISLAHWQRMLLDPEPWFLIQVSSDRNAKSKIVSVVHVDDEWTTAALKALQKLKPSDELGNRSLAVKWEAKHVLAVASAEDMPAALRDRIVSDVGDFRTYAERKTRFVATAGYDPRGRYEMSMTTSLSKDSDLDSEQAADFAIGLREDLPVKDFVVHESRFDIRRLVKKHQGARAVMKFTSGPPSIGRTTITFSTKDRTRSVRLPFDTHVARLLFPRLPDRFAKVRFISSMIEIIARPNTDSFTIRFHVPDDKPMPLSELAKVGEVLALLASQGAAEDGGIVITYEKSGKPVDIGYRTTPFEISSDVREMTEAVRNAAVVAHYFGLPADVQVRPDEVHEQQSQLRSLRALIDRTAGTVAIGLDGQERALAGKRVAVIVPASVRIGDSVLATAIKFHGVASFPDGGARLVVNEGVELLAKWIVQVGQWKEFHHRARVAELAEKQDKRGQYDTVLWPGDTDEDED